MTATITRPQNLNAAHADYLTPSGVRVSCPVYIDAPIQARKTLLNAARSLAESFETTETHTQSGIRVATSTGGLSKLETYLGCSFDILRQNLFQRGGISADLILKIQIATGVEVISVKEIEAGMKAKAALVKAYVNDNPYS